MKVTEQHLTEILTEMFKAVGEIYSPSFCSDFAWFLKRTWTKQQEQSFKEWMILYLRATFRMSKKEATKETEWFIFNYGWRCEEIDANK